MNRLGKITRSGFSLIELSVIMVIISLLAISTLSKFTTGKEISKKKQAMEDLKDIQTALMSFVERNGYYPCPAVPFTAKTEATFGIESRNATTHKCDAGNLFSVDYDNDSEIFGDTGFNKYIGPVWQSPDRKEFIFDVRDVHLNGGATLHGGMAMALADLIRGGELRRLKICAAPDCDAVLVDLSRNRSRIFCDTGNCGNRQHVAAYRERQAAGGPRAQGSQ